MDTCIVIQTVWFCEFVKLHGSESAQSTNLPSRSLKFGADHIIKPAVTFMMLYDEPIFSFVSSICLHIYFYFSYSTFTKFYGNAYILNFLGIL